MLNVSQRRQRTTDPRHGQHAPKFGEDWPCSFRFMRAGRQTDRQTRKQADTLITILWLSPGGQRNNRKSHVVSQRRASPLMATMLYITLILFFVYSPEICHCSMLTLKIYSCSCWSAAVWRHVSSPSSGPFMTSFTHRKYTWHNAMSPKKGQALDISQGSVATHLRCGGIFSDSVIINSLLILTVK